MKKRVRMRVLSGFYTWGNALLASKMFLHGRGLMSS